MAKKRTKGKTAPNYAPEKRQALVTFTAETDRRLIEFYRAVEREWDCLSPTQQARITLLARNGRRQAALQHALYRLVNLRIANAIFHQFVEDHLQ